MAKLMIVSELFHFAKLSCSSKNSVFPLSISESMMCPLEGRNEEM